MATKTHIFRLNEPMRSYALDAFKKLADDQRGEPERAGAGGCSMDSPILYATGVYTWMSEHIGDITNRMAQRYCERTRFGYEMVLEKVNRGLKTMGRDYGFKREMDENLKNNFRDKTERGVIDLSWEEYLAAFQAASEHYADAHSKLEVYNEAQWCAREAAVSLGRMDFTRTLHLLGTLKRHLDSDWVEYAGTVYMDGSGPDGGNVMTYEEARTAKQERVADAQAAQRMVAESDEEPKVIQLRGFGEPKADWPSTKFFDEFYANTQDHPMLPDGERLIMFSENDFAMVTLRSSIDDRKSMVHMEDIRSPIPQKGLGSRALKWLCDLADKHGVTLEGTAKAYRDGDGGTLKNKDLVAWYKRNGFTIGRGDAYEGWSIVRKPRS